MYDLKSAIRLYVLEGHKRGITACSFSSDGRRLVTVSIEEGLSLVWKVGSSIVSFFNPGVPPAGSEPFKKFPFATDGPGSLVYSLPVFFHVDQ
jgi:WD repeat-containing protein 7